MKTLSALLLSLGLLGSIFAQTDAPTLARASEFTIPVSPAFDLLAVNPSQILRPNNIREFKVDWSFRSWRLKPNLAIQAQPIWEVFYNRADLRPYQRTSGLMKTLSTLDFSAGTIEDDSQNRRVALAAKINLYRERDPLSDMEVFSVDTTFDRLQAARMSMLVDLQLKRNRPDIGMRDKLRYEQQMDSIQQEYNNLDKLQKDNIQNLVVRYLRSNWNASHVDLAFGRIFSYNSPQLDSLVLQGQATAFWLSASKGIGRKVLLTGLFKYIVQEKRNAPNLGNNTGNIVSMGMGVRYGGSKFNFFADLLYSQGNAQFVLSDPGLNLTQLSALSISYGGDWRLSRNVMLSYGVRTDYTKQMQFKNIIPVANLACMMR
jgi:hypothetical protein